MDFIMKTLRYRQNNSVKPGILDNDGNIRNASSIVEDWDNNTIKTDRLNELLKTDLTNLPIVKSIDGIAPCLAKESIGKFICIGLNYEKHRVETKRPESEFPTISLILLLSTLGVGLFPAIKEITWPVS